MRKIRRVCFGVVSMLALMLLLAACGGSDSSPSSAETETAASASEASVSSDEAEEEPEPESDDAEAATTAEGDHAEDEQDDHEDDVASSDDEAEAHDEAESNGDEADIDDEAEPDDHSSDDAVAVAAAHGISEDAADVANPIAFNDESVAVGGALFAQTCFVCHGPEGEGDGPGAAGLDPKPASLVADHVQANTDGALFYTISEGSPGTAMVGWEAIISETERWHLVNFIRSLATE